MRAAARKPVAPPAELPRTRALVLFGALALLFAVLVGRSLYLQWVENDFLQGQGAARFSREIEVPAHRGRIVDRNVGGDEAIGDQQRIEGSDPIAAHHAADLECGVSVGNLERSWKVSRRDHVGRHFGQLALRPGLPR